RSYENAIRQLKELRKMGIIIELDDFGTGYSSLSYLSSFPLDIIKIDKSFIDNMLSSDVSLKLIKSIINLAHDLGLKVVAEGIENSDQLNELYTMDCDYIQGFLYSRPIPSDDIENYLLNLPQKHM
ncbi:MAG: EAL domain-containing protein, partial [Spirochaetales bacterium]|nr:EAL domain-containing protein [Spirochaetales bacterium]